MNTPRDTECTAAPGVMGWISCNCSRCTQSVASKDNLLHTEVDISYAPVKPTKWMSIPVKAVLVEGSLYCGAIELRFKPGIRWCLGRGNRLLVLRSSIPSKASCLRDLLCL